MKVTNLIEKDLNAETQRLYTESTIEAQRVFDTLQGNKEKARELADMVGSIVVEDDLPLEVLELTADILKEDVRQVKEAAVGIIEEERALHGTDTGTTLL